MLTHWLAQFADVIQDRNNAAMSDLLGNLQCTLEYCAEKNAVLREVLELQNHGKRIRLSSEQKRRLAQTKIPFLQNKNACPSF